MTIVITLPDFFDGEAAQIVQLLRSSIDLVHIRKPQGTAQQTERLLQAIPPAYRGRLVLHDHHELAAKYHLHGVHLNSRNPLPPQGWQGSVSRSCHSLEEVRRWKDRCDYVSLSPIFDSISKRGYRAAFSAEELAKARDEGVIDHKVLALGGVTFRRMDDVLRMGFGGGMILGDAWKQGQEPVALTIAGSDPSAGAGIQQDLKTMTAIGVYCATVITAVTSQNTLGVSAVLPMPPETVDSQLEAVLSDLHVGSIKIGMVPNAAIAHVIGQAIATYRKRHCCRVVYDPVMISTSGRQLMEEPCVEAVERELFPLCDLVTPNLPETEKLLGRPLHDIPLDGIALARRHQTAFLVKGGHRANGGNGGDDLSTDYLCLPQGETETFDCRMIDTTNLHGTGCALSSAIAAYLLKGEDLAGAVRQAKAFVTSAIERGKDKRIGRGNGPIDVAKTESACVRPE